MNKDITKKMASITLVVLLSVSLVFLSGFYYSGSALNKEIMGINYNSGGQEENEGENDDGEEQQGDEENGVDGAEDELGDETGKWICGECGYVYDPEKGDLEAGIEPGTDFEDLPDDWVCPVCGAPKDKFKLEDEEDEEELDGEGKDWSAHLEHVLSMRSKHIEVLKRVIEKMISRNPAHPSITALQHALEVSSKSILKIEEAIEKFGGNDDDSYGIDANGGDEDTDGDEDTADGDNDGSGLEDKNGKAGEKIKDFLEKVTGKGNDKSKDNRGKGKNK